MKVLHICTGFPLSYQGGITNYVRSLADSQRIDGISVDVLGGYDTKKDDYKFTYIEYSSNIRPFALKKYKDENALEFINKLLKNNKYDVIHIHMMLDIDLDIYSIIKEYKYVISLHDYFYLCPRIVMLDKKGKLCSKFDEKKCSYCIGVLEQNRLINKIQKTIKCYPISIPSKYTKVRFSKFKALLENARYLLPVSNRVKDIYISSGINGNYKMIHIGNISANYFDQYNVQNKNNDRIKVVFIGTLSYHKGAEVLIYILKNISNRNVEFHMYGSIEKGYAKKFEQLGLNIHGRYKQSDLNKIMDGVDIGIVLSIWEDNAPQVVMEFLNFCKPIIATKMGGITDFVNNKNGFLFNPYDENEKKEVVKFINNIDNSKVEKMKSNIKKTKTPEQHSVEIINLYNEIIMQ